MNICKIKNQDNLEPVKDKLYAQVGPTCAIYAFLNGLLQYDKKKKDTVEKLASKMWYWAIDDTKRVNGLIENSEDIYANDLNYSVVGEFFSSENLCKFLNCYKKKICDSLSDEKFGKFNITCVEEIKTNEIPNSEEHNSFYIIPINSWKHFGVNKNNMHWITLKGNQLLDSTKEGYKKLKINSYDRLNDCYLDIHKRCKCKYFNFHKWVKGEQRVIVDIDCYEKALEGIRIRSYKRPFRNGKCYKKVQKWILPNKKVK